MKKLFWIIPLLILMATSSWATTWYGCGANDSNINADSFWEDAVGCDGNVLTWNNQVAGDTFEANGKTGIVVNVDPKGTGGSAGKVILNTAANGTFVHASGDITITADLGVTGNTGTTDVLTISGGTVTVLGNVYGGGSTNADGLVISGTSAVVTVGATGAGSVTINGGGTSTSHGINCATTGSNTTTIYATSTGKTGIGVYTSNGPVSFTGDINGGSGSSGYGLQAGGATGAVTITGNVKAVSSYGVHNNAAGAVTINGNCEGADSTGYAGCYGNSTGTTTVTGNVIATARATGIHGNVKWSPSTNKKYYKTQTGTNYLYLMAGLSSDSDGTAITPANTAAKIATGTYFIKADDYDGSTLTQGTASGGGGCTCGF